MTTEIENLLKPLRLAVAEQVFIKHRFKNKSFKLINELG